MSCHETQKTLVLKHLRTHCYQALLCFRLSERIRELERDGFLINHTPIEKYGRRYMAYSLVEGKRARAA